MAATQMLRASFTFNAATLQSFNALVPQGERSRVMESLMQKALTEQAARLESIAAAFVNDPENAQCIADESLWDSTVNDGLDKIS